jgi:hypothetical protein
MLVVMFFQLNFNFLNFINHVKNSKFKFQVFKILLKGFYDKCFITNFLWQMFYKKYFMTKEHTVRTDVCKHFQNRFSLNINKTWNNRNKVLSKHSYHSLKGINGSVVEYLGVQRIA